MFYSIPCWRSIVISQLLNKSTRSTQMLFTTHMGFINNCCLLILFFIAPVSKLFRRTFLYSYEQVCVFLPLKDIFFMMQRTWCNSVGQQYMKCSDFYIRAKYSKSNALATHIWKRFYIKPFTWVYGRVSILPLRPFHCVALFYLLWKHGLVAHQCVWLSEYIIGFDRIFLSLLSTRATNRDGHIRYSINFSAGNEIAKRRKVLQLSTCTVARPYQVTLSFG